MPTIYRVSGVNSAIYFSRKREAESCKPGGDCPEGFGTVDAVEECQRLSDELAESQRSVARLQHLLECLYDAASGEVRISTAGMRAGEAIRSFAPEAAKYMGL